MFKIAYCAGHYINTPGKRCLASLDPNETREWVLNDRVADYFAKAAAEYEGVELLRTDDPTGKNNVSIESRTKKANDWGANIYVDMHHNAGINGGSGGGVVAFSYPGSSKGKRYRDAIYEAVIAAGGLRGNRSQPLQEKRFDSLRYADAPATLLEYGFMDSTSDTPVILTDAYSKMVAYATMEGIAKVAGLKKKAPAKTQTESYSLEQFVRDVQKACGATVDGIAGPETISKTVTVSESKNRTHAAVKPVQKRLYALGYAEVGTADGVAGSKFTAAVKAFQRDNGCATDGEITAKNKTWRKLLGMS
jgi:N-acetylmuramoyl-L-alanine amidase